MTPTLPSHRRPRPLVALVLLLAVVAAACAGSSDPETRLADAVEDTFDGAFAYAVSLDADRTALDGLGDGAADAAVFLDTFGFSGAVDGEGGASLALTLGGNEPLVEVRAVGEEAFYLNLGLSDLLSLAGAGAFDPRDELAPALDALGLDDEVKTAVLDALDGQWVGVEGELDLTRIRSLLGADTPEVDDEQVRAEAEELFGDSLPAFFERFVTVVEPEDETDGTERFAVQLELRELLRAAGELNQRVGDDASVPLEDLEADLQDLPEVVPGTVVVVDGEVAELRFDIAGTARDAGADVEGSILFQVTVTDVDDVEPIVAPEGATVLTEEQFTDALAKLVGLTGMPGAPG